MILQITVGQKIQAKKLGKGINFTDFFPDISDSHVSDDGLCEIAGLTVVINRATRLPRKCKTQTAVKTDFSGTEELTKTKRGLPFLTHLIANNLLNISWPPKYGSKKVCSIQNNN